MNRTKILCYRGKIASGYSALARSNGEQNSGLRSKKEPEEVGGAVLTGPAKPSFECFAIPVFFSFGGI
jgi:hypothetical protein